MNFDAYRTIADISVALSGFIGIILVLQHRDKSFAELGMATIGRSQARGRLGIPAVLCLRHLLSGAAVVDRRFSLPVRLDSI